MRPPAYINVLNIISANQTPPINIIAIEIEYENFHIEQKTENTYKDINCVSNINLIFNNFFFIFSTIYKFKCLKKWINLLLKILGKVADKLDIFIFVKIIVWSY